MKKIDNNIILKELKNRNEIYDSMKSELLNDIDDKQYSYIQRYEKLTQMEKDLLFLTSQYGKSKTGEILGISRQWVTVKYKEIQNKLHRE